MKFKGLIVLAAVFLMTAVTVRAAVNEPVYERNTGSVTVSGTELANGSTARMVVLKPGVNYEDLKSGTKKFEEACIHIAEYKQTRDDGVYSFPTFKLKEGTPVGEYKILVIEGNSASQEKTIDHASHAQALALITNASDSAEVKGYVDRFNTDVYGLSIAEGTDYYKLSDEAQLVVLGKLIGTTYTDSSALQTKFNQELASYKSIYEAAAFNAIKDSTTAAEVLAAIEKYNRFYGINTEEANFKNFDSTGKEAVYLKMAGEVYTTPGEVQTKFLQKTILYKIQKGPWGTIPQTITDYNSSVLNLDLTKYSPSNTDLLKYLVDKNCKNVSDLQNLIDNYTPSGGGGGGGGYVSRDDDKIDSNGMTGIVFPTTPIPEQPQPNQQGNTTFADVAKGHWAYESIEALYKKNIINGKDNNQFAPEDKVTRSEAIKMIVLAINLKKVNDSEVVFTDMTENAWEYNYVKQAVQANVVAGKGDGTFAGTDNVTRQDLCVMIYRAMLNAGFDLSNGKASFTDANQISDYAVDAINALVEEKIISGMGDGTFAPLATATRAQAAKIIYGVIK